LQIQKYIAETSEGKIQYNISGSGKPSIVLINGGSGPIEGWMKVLPEISKLSSVFSYNRLGVTGSDKPKKAQDGITIVENLREALKIVGFAPPYLLVGHSLGGLYANLFTRLYPNEVTGVIFLESSHPNDTSLDKYQGKIVKTINKMFSIFDSLSTKKQFSEVNFVKQTVNQIKHINSFPDIPLYVITGGKKTV
jgi:pimeloyl-ACP methyl ester carboxylesterase